LDEFLKIEAIFLRGVGGEIISLNGVIEKKKNEFEKKNSCFKFRSRTNLKYSRYK
jgi:hypothetical protein